MVRHYGPRERNNRLSNQQIRSTRRDVTVMLAAVTMLGMVATFGVVAMYQLPIVPDFTPYVP
jgi:hypothetical protein